MLAQPLAGRHAFRARAPPARPGVGGESFSRLAASPSCLFLLLQSRAPLLLGGLSCSPARPADPRLSHGNVCRFVLPPPPKIRGGDRFGGGGARVWHDRGLRGRSGGEARTFVRGPLVSRFAVRMEKPSCRPPSAFILLLGWSPPCAGSGGACKWDYWAPGWECQRETPGSGRRWAAGRLQAPDFGKRMKRCALCGEIAEASSS